MNQRTRRAFLTEVGKGMLVAGLGLSLAHELGATTTWIDDGPEALSFGSLEPLVSLLQELPGDRLLPVLVERLRQGLELRQLTAAAALANARTFGGEHYYGFHVFMALAPAFHMAQELPTERQPLPLLKVLYRNAHYTQAVGGKASQALKPVKPGSSSRDAVERLHRTINQGDRATSEQLLATMSAQSPEVAFNALLQGVEDNHDVHSVVLPWRAWAMLELVGREHAFTLLRQSVRHCAKRSADSKNRLAELERARSLVPKLLDQHQLLKNPFGNRIAEDTWIAQLSETILTASPEQAGEAVAMALAEGFRPEQVGEAISLAANQLVLRQVTKSEGNDYLWRTHGDSLGVHASDTVNAWRNMIRVSQQRHQAAGLILAAVDVSQSHHWPKRNGKTAFDSQPFPHPDHVAAIKPSTPAALLKELDGAVRENDQLRACALVQKYSQVSQESRPVFDLLLGYAISEDGRLHAEKYYRTVVEEYTTTRQAYRWRHVVGLARVIASSYGYSQGDKKEGRAPGYQEACRLLRV